MKFLISIITIFFCVSNTSAQEVYMTSNGVTSFFSKAPLEDIEASNKEVSAALDLSTGEIVVRMNIIDFHFDRNLMEEHFNENYMESEKYPTATYKGKLNTDQDLTEDGKYIIATNGEIEIHGVKRQIETEAHISTVDGVINAKTEFKIITKDHKIKIPRIVIKNIAEVIDVKIDLLLKSFSNDK